MKKKFGCLFFALILLFGVAFGMNVFSVRADYENETVYLGGMPAGFSMQTRGALVAGISDVITANGVESPAKSAGIARGDVIYYIDETEVNGAEDIEKALKSAEEEISLEYMRCGNVYTVFVKPATDINGNKRIGVFIKENVNGIGTVTFIKGNNIATLGHPVLDDNDNLLKIKSGKIFSCNITGCIKGERGKPGELRGGFTTGLTELATIDKNTECGVYGTLTESFNRSELKTIETGEGKMGDAVIWTTVHGNEPKPYKISIVKTDNVMSDTKNYVIKITDKELLDVTGGIVQGMSGSPIVQDGKLVGAITHVFINDPTRGFGISIKTMLNM